MVTLTPLALQNAPVLRILRDDVENARMQRLPKVLARDPSNLRKSILALEAEGLVSTPQALGGTIELTEAGLCMLEALDRAEGNGSQPQGSVAGVESMIPHLLIVPDLLNPRKHFDEEAIEELAATLLADGQLQNLVVRPAAPMEGYGQDMHRLVAGERRWRAAALLIKRGDWPADATMRCLVRDIDDETHARLALIENLQRKDLRPLDEARAFKRLVDDHGYTTAKLAEEIKFTQRFVQQRMQLLELGEADQERLDRGEISIEEARRALANRPAPIELSEDEVIILAEVFHKMNLGQKEAMNWRPAQARFDLLELPIFADMRARQLLTKSYSNDDRRCEIKTEWQGYQALRQHVPGVLEGEAEVRDAALQALYERLGLTHDYKRGYVTEWLNAPFPVPAEVEEAYQAQQRAKEQREKDWQAQRDQVAAERQAQYDKLQAAATLVFESATPPARPLLQGLPELFEQATSPLPWRMGDDGDAYDANKDEVSIDLLDWGWEASARSACKRAIVLAVNAAAGLETPPDLTEAELAAEAASEGETPDEQADGDGNEELEAAE